jgi:hypothetical protein
VTPRAVACPSSFTDAESAIDVAPSPVFLSDVYGSYYRPKNPPILAQSFYDDIFLIIGLVL